MKPGSPSLRDSFQKFKAASPSPVALPVGEAVVQTGFLGPEEAMPVVLTPVIEDVDLIEWARAHRNVLDGHLRRFGAILFRGFGPPSVDRFQSFCSACCENLFGEYGDLPHEALGEGIYHSTPYPPDKTILFHNESSHMPSWPRKQFFCCVQPAEERGETPIADCREVYRRLDPGIREAFETKGLLYVRNFIAGVDVSVREFFGTEDRGEIESRYRGTPIEVEFLDGGQVRLRQRAPAVLRHPDSGEKVFFNQLMAHHDYFLDADVRASLRGMFGDQGLPRQVYFGDGSPIPDEVAETIRGLYWDICVEVEWQRGDIVLLDNVLVAHARNPYRGQRKILVALGDLMSQEEIH